MNNKNEFLQTLESWKEIVATTCDRYAKNKDLKLDLDFYVFQSSVRLNPPLLLIGTNPGGMISYSDMNKRNNRECRTANDLGYDSNQFIENKEWHSNSLYKLFSGNTLLPLFKDAVITNLVYFNTGNFAEFKRRKGANDAIKFCKTANRDLIEILQPVTIILMGNIALNGMAEFFDKPMVPVLTTTDGKTALIRQTTINGFRTIWIHHPSMNKKFNTGENLKLKEAALEKILTTKQVNV